MMFQKVKSLKRDGTDRRNTEINLTTQYIIIRKQGAAMNVEPNAFISEWYNVPESAPHVTLLVKENYRAKDLGPMMKTALGPKWEQTENLLIFQSQDATMIKMLCSIPAITKTTGSDGTGKPNSSSSKAKTSESDLLEEIISNISGQVWSNNDADVGLGKSANPVTVELRSNVKLPSRPQYPLKPEAEEGVGFVGE